MTSFITIALGAFDIRDKVDSVDAKDTTLASSTYVQGIAAVCDDREDSQITRRDDALELKRRMKRTLDFPQQRVLLLEFVNRDLDRGDHTLSMFAGLEAPSETIDEHRAVRLRWEGNVDLLRVHRDRVEASVTRTGLLTVLDRLDRSRFETATRRVEVGLRKLGGPACRIGQRQSMPVVTLPPPATSSSPASFNNVVPPDTATPDTAAPDPNIVPSPTAPNPNIVPSPPREAKPEPGS